jgi:hypothetical protein
MCCAVAINLGPLDRTQKKWVFFHFAACPAARSLSHSLLMGKAVTSVGTQPAPLLSPSGAVVAASGEVPLEASGFFRPTSLASRRRPFRRRSSERRRIVHLCRNALSRRAGQISRKVAHALHRCADCVPKSGAG